MSLSKGKEKRKWPPEIEFVYPFDKDLCDKWYQRAFDNKVPEPSNIREISDSELSDRLFNHIIKMNGPMLGNYSFYGMVLEASRRLKGKS